MPVVTLAGVILTSNRGLRQDIARMESPAWMVGFTRVVRGLAPHNIGMRSRVHPRYKTKYHVRNWAAYERGLVRRGDITVWLSADAIAAWEPAGGGTRGGQRKYSDVAIKTALTLRLLLHLPLRQTEGFLTSLFRLMELDLPSPDHTTLSRRGQQLDVTLHHPPREKPLHLLIDSTGLSLVGEGEWAAAKHGRHGKHGWRKRLLRRICGSLPSNLRGSDALVF